MADYQENRTVNARKGVLGQQNQGHWGKSPQGKPCNWERQGV